MPLRLKNFSRTARLTKKSKKYEQDFIQAVKEDDMDAVKKLTRDKIRILAPILWEEAYVYPIHIGCALGSLEMVKLLFRIGCSLETKTESGKTPLHFSCAYNITHPEVTGHLLDMGAKPNIKDKLTGSTPFHFASESNNYGAAKKLLEVTKRFVQDNNGKTAKDVAIENDCDQIVGLFEAYDEECRQKEELLRLPGRLEDLEKKTNFLLRHSSLQSMNDSGLEGSSLDFHASASGLLSLHVEDRQDGSTQRRQSLPSVPVYKGGSHKRLASVSISEEQYSTLVNQSFDGPPPALRISFPSMSKMPVKEELETPTPQPLTRDSPLGALHSNQVRRHYSFLNSMIKPDKLIIKLFSKSHIDLDSKERLNKMPTQQDKNDYLLTNHVLKGSMALYEDFLQGLRDTDQEHIANKLSRVHESPLYGANQEANVVLKKEESLMDAVKRVETMHQQIDELHEPLLADRQSYERLRNEEDNVSLASQSTAKESLV